MKMKNIIITNIKVVITIVLCFTTQYLYCSVPITIWPHEIKFNYEIGNNNDALKIKNGYNTDVPVPEWKYNGGNVISEKFAYIKAQTNRNIQVSFDSNCTDSMHLLLKLTAISSDGIGNVCNYFISNYSKLSFVTLKLEGTILNSVGKRSYTWTWEIYAIPNNVATYCAAKTSTNTTHTYYTLLSNPQVPMQEPWVDVLDKACDWSLTQSTQVGVAQKITEGIYYLSDLDGDIDYDYTETKCHYSDGSDHRLFYLKEFLTDIKIKSSVLVNCSDVANLFNIFSSAIGIATNTKRIIMNDSPYSFITNSIDPIGSTKGWTTDSWYYHQFGWYNETVNDPCLQVNYSNPNIPSNMPQGTYDGYLLSTGSTYNYSDTGVTAIIIKP